MKGSETVDHGETEQIIQMDQEVVKNKEESKKLERENQNLEFQAQALREQLCIADEVGLPLGSMNSLRHINNNRKSRYILKKAQHPHILCAIVYVSC